MDEIRKLATEWWRSKNSFQKTALRRKYQKGEKHDYFIHISIQDIMEMYEAEHTSIKEGLEDYEHLMGIKYKQTPLPDSRFILSTDTYEIPTYVLARVTGKSVEIILNKSIKDKASFEEEANNLQKYFNAKLIK